MKANSAKPNRRAILISSLCVLLPMLAGAVLWGRLPDQIATHFNWRGEADGWSGKISAVFGLPLFLLAAHSLCLFVTSHDPRRENIHGKIFNLILWICPAVSLFVAAIMYPHALGYPMDTDFLGMIFTGSLFLIVGNYLPKCRRNYTVGIKLPWTLADEDNWNRTHRMAGPLWIVAGLLTVLSALCHIAPAVWIMLAALSVAGIAPVIYSAALYISKKRSNISV